MFQETTVKISPEDLLAGANMTYEVSIPPDVLYPGSTKSSERNGHPESLIVEVKPLTIGTFQLIMKAANADPGLIPLLMVKESLQHPALSLDQIRGMHVGLLKFLVEHIRRISGLGEKKSP